MGGSRFPVANGDIYNADENALGALACDVFEGELTVDLIDYDSLIGFGRLCGDKAAGLDVIALDWMRRNNSEKGLDIVCGFLWGYWQQPKGLSETTKAQVEALMELRTRLPLEKDSAKGSADAVLDGLKAPQITDDERRGLALRMLDAMDADQSVRHRPMTTIGLRRMAKLPVS